MHGGRVYQSTALATSLLYVHDLRLYVTSLHPCGHKICSDGEQVMHYEAVHPFTGWKDLQRRLAPDRRVFAFFHQRYGLSLMGCLQPSSSTLLQPFTPCFVNDRLPALSVSLETFRPIVMGVM